MPGMESESLGLHCIYLTITPLNQVELSCITINNYKTNKSGFTLINSINVHSTADMGSDN